MSNVVLKDAAFRYRILYIHQRDSRGFNRGALKNIGFMVVKEWYPNDYKNMTLVFHDIDSLLATATTVGDLRTQPGTIRHYFGFTFTLGGIFSINAGDFERINGFPNFWTWGYEDNLIQIRALHENIVIDRSLFFSTKDNANIIRLEHDTIRSVNRDEYNRYVDNTPEGIDSISELTYKMNASSLIGGVPAFGEFVDVLYFNTGVSEAEEKTRDFNLMYGNKPFHLNTNQIVQANFRSINYAAPRTVTKVESAPSTTTEFIKSHSVMSFTPKTSFKKRPNMSMRLF